MLRFLKIRVIINGHDIYPLKDNKKIVIEIPKNNSKIVVTDGFHITKPLEVVFHHIHTYYFSIVCAISDFQLIAGILMMVFCATFGIMGNYIILKLLCFFPIFYFLFLYYVNRHEFIQLKAG